MKVSGIWNRDQEFGKGSGEVTGHSSCVTSGFVVPLFKIFRTALTSWNRAGSEGKPDVLRHAHPSAHPLDPKVKVAPDSRGNGKKREIFILVKKRYRTAAKQPPALGSARAQHFRGPAQLLQFL